MKILQIIKTSAPSLMKFIALLSLMGGIVFSNTPSLSNNAVGVRVADRVMSDLRLHGETEFFVVLKQKGNIEAAGEMTGKENKGRFVYDTLRRIAIESQSELIRLLDSRGVSYQQFWTINQVLVKGDVALLTDIRSLSDVIRIDANPAIKGITDPQPDSSAPRIATPDNVEWGIKMINADDVWNTYGVRGEGIVVAGQDTGVNWEHPALKGQYRGWNGASADHNYNWHDAIHDSAVNPCGNDSPTPCDDHNHGTHTMGTMVGDDGGDNQIGVAPGARWIACRNMDRGSGTPASYIECFEWFIAPYPADGNPLTDGDPSKAPHIINNSWGCPPGEGCNQNTLDGIVAITRSAGIMVIASSGNSGPACNSTIEPPGIYRHSFSVGATDSGNGLASFSSRGPVIYNGETYIKPNVSAPGHNVRSSVKNGGYAGGWSGTSMASPHVAGAVALLWSAVPQMKGHIDLTEDILESTAVPMDFTSCGDAPGVPNNGYGYGIVDALNALEHAAPGPDIEINGSDGPATIPQGTPVSITVSLNPGALAGLPAEWWVAALMPDGSSYWYTVDSGWIQSAVPLRAYQGALIDLSHYPVLDSASGLPSGAYLLGFAVDDHVNNILELQWYDTVEMTICNEQCAKNN